MDKGAHIVLGADTRLLLHAGLYVPHTTSDANSPGIPHTDPHGERVPLALRNYIVDTDVPSQTRTVPPNASVPTM